MRDSTTAQSLTHHGLTPTNPSKQQLVSFAASGGGAREDRTAAVPSLEQRSASAAVSAGARRSRPVALPRDEGLVHRVHHVDVPVDAHPDAHLLRALEAAPAFAVRGALCEAFLGHFCH